MAASSFVKAEVGSLFFVCQPFTSLSLTLYHMAHGMNEYHKPGEAPLHPDLFKAPAPCPSPSSSTPPDARCEGRRPVALILCTLLSSAEEDVCSKVQRLNPD